MSDATFSALMRLLERPEFVAGAVVLAVIILVGAWEFFLRGLEKWRITDLRIVGMDPTPDDVAGTEAARDSMSAALEPWRKEGVL